MPLSNHRVVFVAREAVPDLYPELVRRAVYASEEEPVAAAFVDRGDIGTTLTIRNR